VIKYNPTILLKVPQDSYRRCNESDILSEYLFWLRLKSINIEGAFQRGSWNYVSKKLNISIVMIRKYLNRLLQIGWISKTNGSYQLVSYNRLWHSIGYEFKDKGGLKTYKIFKVQVDKLDLLNAEIACNELKENFQQQERACFKRHMQKVLGADTDQTASPSFKGLCRILRKRFKIDSWFKYQLFHIRKNNTFTQSVNYDISLSCSSFAKLLGYKSSKSGWEIEQLLQRSDYIIIANRKLLVMKNISLQQFTNMQLPSYFLFLHNNLYRQMPNKISFVS
jgi:hypothetical protein